MNQKLFLPSAKTGFLLSSSKTCFNVALFSIFPQNFFGTNFRDQNKNNVIETTRCFVDQQTKKYCVYYVSEHLKYCTEIKEYWLNKNFCVYYMSEHLKYCTQINEYWLNKNFCVYYVSEHLKYCTQIKEYWLNKNVSEHSIDSAVLIANITLLESRNGLAKNEGLCLWFLISIFFNFF